MPARAFHPRLAVRGAGTSRRGRLIACGAGLLLAAIGGGADWILPGERGFGPLQLLWLLAGLAILPMGLLTGFWQRGYARVASVVFSTYLGFLICEAALDLTAPPPRTGMASLRGAVQASPWGGFELTPNWHGVYDDGAARSAVDINQRGDRDDDLRQQPRAARVRVLLLGDSQAFGMGLRREETIESQIEQLSRGALAAYNLGVPGYGPGDSLEHYRERQDVNATHAFFLLFGNDLHRNNCRTAYHTAFAGIVVPRERVANGLSPEELQREITAVEMERRRAWRDRIRSVALLERLRTRLGVLLDRDRTLLSGRAGDFSDECSRAAARNADAMRSLAEERGQEFAVVIVPTPGEAGLQRYSQPMQVCIDELKRLSVPILEVRALLTPDDYLERDEHLGRTGAAKVAGAIARSAS